jgi:fibro-slime domain-containing protein
VATPGSGGASSIEGLGSGGAPVINCGGASTTGCTAQNPEGCGDGINNQGGIEACDDGNTLPGDGCNGICKVERNWDCPPAGKCTPQVICGDSKIGAGEVCDDANQTDGDGCNANCTVQDPAYTCTPGQPCVRKSFCGDGRIEAGENCEDGNTQSGDGCDANCKLETGWVCPTPGSACKRAARCGDGVVNSNLGEVCDDANTADGDGCSADCRVKGAGCTCTPGQLCQCPEVRCGNGTIEGTEQCDDGAADSGDGCSSSCQIERGYECPFSGAPCMTNCGDGITMGSEQCDPGLNIANIAQACSATCRWNPGWACSGTGCHRTTCGDGTKEGVESCDDRNTTPGDGCSPTCTVEPSCSPSTGTCTSICGDGIVMPAQPDGPVSRGGGCDDGNNLANDGCSSDCQVEPGYQCQQPPMADKPSMTVPVTYRDFRAGGDFEPGGAVGLNVAVTGLVQGTLDSQGKPVFSGATGGYITSTASFANWYRDVGGTTNSTYKTTMTLYNNGNGGFVNRYGANGEKWTVLSPPTKYWCGSVGQEDHDAAGVPIPCTFCPYDADPSTPQCDGMQGAVPNTRQKTDCQTEAAPGEVPAMRTDLVDCVSDGNTWHGIFVEGAYDGNPAFFPLDNVPGMITPTSEYSTCTVPPAYGLTWTAEANPAPNHNFHFTSEIRYWFGYVAGKSYVLDFSGDDDVWVFVNRQLAVDLGGIHTSVNGRIELNANGGATVTITQTEPQGAIPAPRVLTVNLGMASGGVYEIVVFQAERKTSSSTYKLTLTGFNDAPSECQPICGDGVASAGEQCDNGAQNLGGYNQCKPDCTRGPYCGDGNLDAGYEACDNGANADEYGSAGGCAPNCQLPARCGDALVQMQYGEECDDGVNDGAYGGCTTDCQRAGYCGDGVKTGPEACDDGKNDGTYGTCGDPSLTLPNCGAAPKCGDGIVQAVYGEQCEPALDPNCTPACRNPGGCGDGIVQAPEQCDSGSDLNNGEYGGCAPSCIYAPHCGDGIKNGPEECDEGYYDGSKYTGGNGSYGGCTAQCKLAGHCGDGILQSPQDYPGSTEECDSGAMNGSDLICTTACKKVVYVPT